MAAAASWRKLNWTRPCECARNLSVSARQSMKRSGDKGGGVDSRFRGNLKSRHQARCFSRHAPSGMTPPTATYLELSEAARRPFHQRERSVQPITIRIVTSEAQSRFFFK